MLKRSGAVALALTLALATLGAMASSAAASPGDPIGRFDNVSARFDNKWFVSGWAADPERAGRRIQVRLYFGATFIAQVPTGDGRPDVAFAVPGVGPGTGWHATVDLTFSNGNPLCAYAINVGAGSNQLLGCQVLPRSGADPSNPLGRLDAAIPSSGSIELIGWGADLEGDRTTQIRIYDNGSFVTERTTDVTRLDVIQAWRGAGSEVGFDITLPLAPGTHFLCAYVQNTGLRGLQNTTAGCATRVVPS
jgi:hypothetical protein